MAGVAAVSTHDRLRRALPPAAQLFRDARAVIQLPRLRRSHLRQALSESRASAGAARNRVAPCPFQFGLLTRSSSAVVIFQLRARGLCAPDERARRRYSPRASSALLRRRDSESKRGNTRAASHPP